MPVRIDGHSDFTITNAVHPIGASADGMVEETVYIRDFWRQGIGGAENIQQVRNRFFEGYFEGQRIDCSNRSAAKILAPYCRRVQRRPNIGALHALDHLHH